MALEDFSLSNLRSVARLHRRRLGSGWTAPAGALALALLLALGLAACGSDDSGSGVGSDESGTTETAPIDEDSSISSPDPEGDEGEEGEEGEGEGEGEEGEEGEGEGEEGEPGTCEPGEADFECPCSGNTDCASGLCIETPTGSICTESCVETCRPGYSCKAVFLPPDTIFICIPDVSNLCLPCTTDLQCGGEGACTSDGRNGYCTLNCADEGCPTGYECRDNDVEANGGFARQCEPVTGTCDCTPELDGAVRTCTQANEFGECSGVETCDPEVGWVGCDALPPMEEMCNGADDDCNGLVDDGLPTGEACEKTVEGVGICVGTDICTGVNGWLCTAPDPTDEICDFTDNNCDGNIDEAFTDESGAYSLFDHCGTCNQSCGIGFPNATTKCDGTKEPPQCVVVTCDEGFFKLNDFQCVPETTTLCQACGSDSDCVLDGAKCLDLGDGSYCGTACETAVDCPVGYVCADYEGSLQCQPESGTCSCDGSNLDLQQSCSVTYVDPVDPDAPSYTCLGTEFCEPEGWGACQLPDDDCDGLDNDCDGDTDEDFVNAEGVYVTDENCGICGNNCAVLSFANGSGTCDSSGLVPFCALQCDDDFFDVNTNPSDGCECAFDGLTDLPDGIDQNCDGVDGEVDNAVFVAKNGNDANDGSLDNPLLTIGAALSLADATNKRDIYVATGVYQESILMRQEIGLYGGYSSDFLQRDKVLYETVIVGLAPTAELPGAVNAVGLDGPLGTASVLNAFTLFGYNNSAPGGSSYALYVRNSSAHVVLTENTIYAGNGGNGTPGSAGTDGDNGVTGVVGMPATDAGVSICVASTPEGGGGSKVCGGTNVSGGNGGAAICPDYDESGPGLISGDVDQTAKTAELGKGGQGPGAGAGGDAGNDFIVQFGAQPCTACTIPPDNQEWVGSDGEFGDDGADGDGDAGCGAAGGSVVGGLWVGGAGGSGASGLPGAGGGGGGAGGGVEVDPACFAFGSAFSDRGGSGGGGGSGACSGTGGSGGSTGGGSFGVFLVWSSAPSSVPVVEDNEIRPGFGGAGGSGGSGGAGGIGGDGAVGGIGGATTPNAFCAAPGGDGGAGGDGGHGGGGGGGCGGVSFGIYADGASGGLLAPLSTANDFVDGGNGGLGGFGGLSLGSPGSDGSVGLSGDTNF